jgi:hypothetical protein
MTLKQALKSAIKSRAFSSREVTLTEQGYLICSEKTVSKKRIPVYYRYYRPVKIFVYANRENRFGSNAHGKKWRVQIPIVSFFSGEISRIAVLERLNSSENAQKNEIDTVTVEVTYDDGFKTSFDSGITYKNERVQTSYFHDNNTLDLRHITPYNGFSIDINSYSEEVEEV